MSDDIPSAPLAKLAGQLLLEAPGWTLRCGSQPHIEPITVTAEAALEMMKGPPVPVDLVLGDSGVFKNLYIIQTAPGDAPALARVLVADRRVWWEYAHVKRKFNVRRRTGVKRLNDPTDVGQIPIIDTVAYQPSSLLKNGKAWEARMVLSWVFEQVMKPEKELGGPDATLTYDDTMTDRLHDVPVEDLEIDAVGSEAIDAVLRYLPGAQIRCERDGNFVCYSQSNSGEIPQLLRCGPEAVGYGHVAIADLSRLRPNKFQILFEREIELRIDYEEFPEATTSDNADARVLFNVAPSPDFSATGDNGRSICQNTWTTIDELLRSWGPAPFKTARRLTKADVRQLLVPYMNLSAALQLQGLSQPDIDWAARVGALQAHYRRTFQINRRWMDRIDHLLPSRVATLDVTTGTRGAAAVWSDFAYLPTMRSLAQQLNRNQDLSYVVNVACYPAGGVISATTPRAPADLSIVDEQQGIIHIDYRMDPTRMYDRSLPSQVELVDDGTAAGAHPTNPGPCGDLLTKARRSISFDALGQTDKAPQLTGKWACAIILTATPSASPELQTEVRQMYHVEEIEPVHLPFFAGRERCFGPTMQIRVPRSLETARVAWLDSKADDIERCFGLKPGVPDVSSITVNAGFAQGNSGGSLGLIAKAICQRVAMSMADRNVGTRAAHAKAQLTPDGWLAQVRYQITAKGEQFALLSLPDRVPKMDLLHFLDSSVQRVVLNLAMPGSS